MRLARPSLGFQRTPFAPGPCAVAANNVGAGTQALSSLRPVVAGKRRSGSSRHRARMASEGRRSLRPRAGPSLSTSLHSWPTLPSPDGARRTLDPPDCNQRANSGERKRKGKKAKWLSFAFFHFLLVFGIGTFQRVTTEKSQKNFLPFQLAQRVVIERRFKQTHSFLAGLRPGCRTELIPINKNI